VSISLNSLLSTARSAMMAHQAALQVVSDNIANASTEGYTRKRADIVASTPQRLPEGMLGTGVTVKNIAQTRDIFLDASHRVNVSAERYNDVRYDTLREIETIMAEPSDRGLSSTFDAFWSAWGDLANDPLNQASRTVVRQRGEQLAMHFNTLTTALDRLRDSTVQRLDATLQSVNTLATQIADLNERIVAAEAGGQTAGHLRDTRDLALDKLAELVPVQIIERANGSVAASVDGLNLVDGADHGSLQASFAGGSWSIRTGQLYRRLFVCLKQFFAATDDADVAHEVTHAQGAGPTGTASRWQCVVWPGVVVAEGFRGVWPKEDRASVLDLLGVGLGVFG
jgi:flagellar hook-associated protein 1 FlgK